MNNDINKIAMTLGNTGVTFENLNLKSQCYFFVASYPDYQNFIKAIL